MRWHNASLTKDGVGAVSVGYDDTGVGRLTVAKTGSRLGVGPAHGRLSVVTMRTKLSSATAMLWATSWMGSGSTVPRAVVYSRGAALRVRIRVDSSVLEANGGHAGVLQ